MPQWYHCVPFYSRFYHYSDTGFLDGGAHSVVPFDSILGFITTLIKDFQLVWCTPFESLLADHVIHYMKGSAVHCMVFILLLGEGGKEKGSELPFKYTY